jgi:lysophospholipid acyltransferase (LPLAT)-like uncharacterized protein
MKKLLDSPMARTALGLMVGAWMRFVGATTRWEVVNDAAPRSLDSGPAIVVFWHGRMMLAHTLWIRFGRAPSTQMLISQSRDGDIVACATRMIRIGTIRGSTEKDGKPKGGIEAMREMMRVLRNRSSVAITPDGPKGPRMRAQMGPVQLAKLSGAPIVGLAWSVRNSKVMKSWDRLLLPGPFGRGAYVFTDLMHVDRRASDADMEAARRRMESELTRITQEADRRVGAQPVEPADLPAATPSSAEASVA